MSRMKRHLESREIEEQRAAGARLHAAWNSYKEHQEARQQLESADIVRSQLDEDYDNYARIKMQKKIRIAVYQEREARTLWLDAEDHCVDIEMPFQDQELYKWHGTTDEDELIARSESDYQ